MALTDADKKQEKWAVNICLHYHAKNVPGIHIAYLGSFFIFCFTYSLNVFFGCFHVDGDGDDDDDDGGHLTRREIQKNVGRMGKRIEG